MLDYFIMKPLQVKMLRTKSTLWGQLECPCLRTGWTSSLGIDALSLHSISYKQLQRAGILCLPSHACLGNAFSFALNSSADSAWDKTKFNVMGSHQTGWHPHWQQQATLRKLLTAFSLASLIGARPPQSIILASGKCFVTALLMRNLHPAQWTSILAYLHPLPA